MLRPVKFWDVARWVAVAVVDVLPVVVPSVVDVLDICPPQASNSLR